MNLFGQIEILDPICDFSTLKDGRGAIFSWIPEEVIREFTLLYFNPGKIRGNHFHPEFVEYFLVISGSLALVTFDENSRETKTKLIGPGFCFRTPKNVSHAVQAITESVCVSLITKTWSSCENPIIYDKVIEVE